MNIIVIWAWLIGKQILYATLFIITMIGCIMSSMVLGYTIWIVSGSLFYAVCVGIFPWFLFYGFKVSVLDKIGSWASSGLSKKEGE